MTRRPTDRHLRPRLARYIASLRPPADAARRAIEEAAAARGETIASPEQAALLEALAAADPAGTVLELGTGAGYATLHLARGAHAGRVISVDRDAAALERARAALAADEVAGRIELIQADALDYLGRGGEPFQLVVIDLDAGALRRAVDLALPLLATGGRLAVLRVLADGPPGEATRTGARDDWERERLHPYLTIHPQLASVLLPIGDGVALGVKRRPTIRELGGPF